MNEEAFDEWKARRNIRKAMELIEKIRIDSSSLLRHLNDDVNQVMDDTTYNVVVEDEMRNTSESIVEGANRASAKLAKVGEFMDGAQQERNLVNRLTHEYDHMTGIRLAASGGGTANELPDVFACDIETGQRYVIEMKSTSGDYTGSVKEQEIKDLQTFADNWDAEPYIAFRFSNDLTFYFMPIGGSVYEEHLTDTGNIIGKRGRRDEYIPEETLFD